MCVGSVLEPLLFSSFRRTCDVNRALLCLDLSLSLRSVSLSTARRVWVIRNPFNLRQQSRLTSEEREIGYETMSQLELGCLDPVSLLTGDKLLSIRQIKGCFSVQPRGGVLSLQGGSAPALAWRERVENHLVKIILPGSNPDLPVLGSLVSCKSNALDHTATEAADVWISSGLIIITASYYLFRLYAYYDNYDAVVAEGWRSLQAYSPYQRRLVDTSNLTHRNKQTSPDALLLQPGAKVHSLDNNVGTNKPALMLSFYNLEPRNKQTSPDALLLQPGAKVHSLDNNVGTNKPALMLSFYNLEPRYTP
uniref:Uncharacterized protein n=1 Tax=Timema monikensis TaxID=170555 RepID=A0A7R9HSA9_9NEOP|nr:unnamed protein product [Timema monikensis]